MVVLRMSEPKEKTKFVAFEIEEPGDGAGARRRNDGLYQ